MRIITALSMIAAVVAVACGGDKIQAPKATVEGSYALQSVNGKALPIAFTLNDVPVQLTASSIDVRPDRTFSYSYTLRVSDGRSGSDGFDGTYVLDGNTVTFSADGKVMMTMSWNGSNQLTDNSDGVPWIYKK